MSPFWVFGFSIFGIRYFCPAHRTNGIFDLKPQILKIELTRLSHKLDVKDTDPITWS